MLSLDPRDLESYIEADDQLARKQLRALFRRSAYSVFKVLVGWNEPRNLVDPETYKERQDWLQWVYTDKKRGLLEDPRSFVKSSGHTRTMPVWVGIQRPDARYDAPSEILRATDFLAAHPHILGPDSKFVLCGDTESNAGRFTASIKAIFETNPLLRWCYPELCWPDGRPSEANARWSNKEFHLPGRQMVEEPNPFMRAAGADSAIVGGRAGFVIFNDLVGDHNWKSETAMAALREYIGTAPAMLADRDPQSPYGGVVVVEGNRWSLNDVNSKVHDEYTDWAIWRRGIQKCYSHGAGNCGRWGSDSAKTCAPAPESLWTARYPDLESVARVVKDAGSAEVAAAQYYNDPRTASELNENNLRDFYVEVRVISVDGAPSRMWCVVIPGEGSEEVIPIPTLKQHLISIDPAASDEPNSARTAISWFARDALTGRRFWLECKADRWRADSGEVEPHILDMVRTVEERSGQRPRIIVEKVAAQGYLASALKTLAQLRRMRLPEVELIRPAKGLSKLDRIKRRVGFIMSQGLLYVRTGLALPHTEVRHFPTGTKDALDTAAQAEDVFLSSGPSTVDSDKLRAARNRRRGLRLDYVGRTGASL